MEEVIYLLGYCTKKLLLVAWPKKLWQRYFFKVQCHFRFVVSIPINPDQFEGCRCPAEILQTLPKNCCWLIQAICLFFFYFTTVEKIFKNVNFHFRFVVSLPINPDQFGGGRCPAEILQTPPQNLLLIASINLLLSYYSRINL